MLQRIATVPPVGLSVTFRRMKRRYVFYSTPAAGSSGGTFIPPVELAA